MEMLGLDLRSAREWMIMNDTGVDDPVAPAAPTPAPAPAPVSLDEAYAYATQQRLPQWWFDRGFTWETARRWGIRYLASHSKLVIPVRFPYDGALVGLIYRAMDGSQPKYRNTPDFPRKSTLFGYGSQSNNSTILLTEGPLDAINAAQHGFAAFATFGAYVAPQQIALMARLTQAERYIVAYDNDEAGLEAARHVTDQLWDVGAFAKIFKYPEGRKDVGECAGDEIKTGIEQAISR